MLGVSISLMVTLNNTLIFFIFITPIILWRFYLSIKNRKYFNKFSNFIKFSNNIVWVIHHFSFIFLFLLYIINKGS
jgi:hypothetical protein